MSEASRDRCERSPTVWTWPLQIVTAACSIVFTVGTILWGLIMVTSNAVEQSMRQSGMSAAEVASAAETFTTVGIVVGVLYVIGNAVGVLALRGWTWVFWVAVVINLTQGLGAALGAVPREVFQVVVDKYGTLGVLPSLITDWGGLVVAVMLIASFVIFRAPWARRRDAFPSWAS